MATRAIRPKRDEGLLAGNWESLPERAPSIVRAERPLATRIVAFISLVMVAVGGLAMVQAARGKGYLIGPDWGFVWFSLGVGGLLYHAFRDAEVQYRRVYGMVGAVLLLAGVALRVRPQLFLIFGIPSLALGMLFFVAVARNETDAFLRTFMLRLLGILGGIMILAGLIGGNISPSYVQVEGAILLVLGLLFVGAYIGLLGTASEEGYWAGFALGVAGLLGFIAAVLQSLFVDGFLVPSGYILMTACAVYLMVAFGACSEMKLVVLTRRELSALFYSPIAYFVFLGVLIVGWISFGMFLSGLRGRGGIFESFMLVNYFLNYPTVVCVTLVVPLVTMRLLSEEKRSGTLEVLLTAPVNESSIVLSKFSAVLLFYILAFVPWGLFLVGLRIFGGEPFDYRPVLSFFIAMVFTGAGFLSVGLFWSSLVRNQIVAAVLTSACMLAFTAIYLVSGTLSGTWAELFGYVSYLDLWLNSLQGLFTPRHLFFHFSLAFFFLYLTTKVLEARKWT